MIHVPAHLVDAPAGPSPDLRRHEIENGNAVRMSPTRHPPVEPGIVDEQHGIGPPLAEIAIRLPKELHKAMQMGENAQEADDRQTAKRKKQTPARRCHARSAEADAF